MKEIHIIDKIELSPNGLTVKGSKQEVHLRQGDLDGACGVYSMMMCLVIEKIVKKDFITNVPESLKRNTSYGRLVSHFLEKKGMVINGYEGTKELAAELQSAFKKKVDVQYFDEGNILEIIINYLKENHPVEIKFNRIRTYGHFVVVIGYREEENFTDLYCLDPGFPMGKAQMWNNVLRINTTSSAMYNGLNMQEDRKINVDEVMVCIKRPTKYKKMSDV